MGPRATKLVAEGADGEKLTDFVIEPARIQMIIASLCIMGFSLLGRDFIQLWLGKGYEDVYKITLILIVPVVIPLIESVTNNILDAKMKRMARSPYPGVYVRVQHNRFGYSDKSDWLYRSRLRHRAFLDIRARDNYECLFTQEDQTQHYQNV